MSDCKWGTVVDKNDNLDSFGHLVLVHVVELHVESLAGEDHSPALADQAGSDDGHFVAGHCQKSVPVRVGGSLSSICLRQVDG